MKTSIKVETAGSRHHATITADNRIVWSASSTSLARLMSQIGAFIADRTERTEHNEYVNGVISMICDDARESYWRNDNVRTLGQWIAKRR